MNIQETDFAPEALKAAVEAGSHLNTLESLVKADKHQSAETDALLVMLFCLTRKLVDYIRPLQSTGEIHGLPKLASDPDRPEPIIFRKDNPKIDFGHWYEEKTTRLHQAIFRIARSLISAGPKDDSQKSLLDLNMAEAIHLASTISDMLNSGGLVIREIRMGDDE